MEEIWKDVVGYEGYYKVSNLGRIKSLMSGKIMSHYTANNGYEMLRFGKCGHDKKQLVLLHRVVAEAFIPNPDNLPQVGHKDENRSHNEASNLEWVTIEKNNNETLHKQRISKGRKGVNNANRKFLKIECENKNYNSLLQFCKIKKLNPATVWRWLNNKTQMPEEWINKGLKYRG